MRRARSNTCGPLTPSAPAVGAVARPEDDEDLTDGLPMACWDARAVPPGKRAPEEEVGRFGECDGAEGDALGEAEGDG